MWESEHSRVPNSSLSVLSSLRAAWVQERSWALLEPPERELLKTLSLVGRGSAGRLGQRGLWQRPESSGSCGECGPQPRVDP